jgi:hypothetical protein
VTIDIKEMEEDAPWEFDRDRSCSHISIGLGLGLFHCLTPDHLAALSALSVGGGWKSFTTGVRWSVGHSISLTIVTAIFITFKGRLDLHSYSRYFDVAVGGFMIAIGSYGILSSVKTWNDKQKKKLDASPARLSGVAKKKAKDEEMALLSTPELEREDSVASFDDLNHHHDLPTHIPLLDMNDKATQRVVSLAMGLLHGVAGPGGILGVLPAVEMQHWQSSTIYLSSFVIGSTISMGCFAALYGEATRRLGASAGESVEMGLRLFSSLASVLVGVVWIAVTFSQW